MHKYEYILFDLDGTLTDSGPGIKHCVRYAYEKLNIPCPPETELNTFVGPPLADSFLAHAVPKDKVDEAVRLFRSLYNVSGKFDNTPYPHIQEALALLKESGLHLYVATSKPQNVANEVLSHFKLDQYFERIEGSDSKKVKKADVIASVINDKDPSSIVMVGDTKYDVIGAAQNHIACIGVLWGYGKKKELQDAAYIVQTPEELVKILI